MDSFFQIFPRKNFFPRYLHEDIVEHNLQKPEHSHGKDSIKYVSGNRKEKEKCGDSRKGAAECAAD